MIETKNPEINVDELMEKIREEVRRRKQGGGLPPRTVPRTADVPQPAPQTSVPLPNISPIGDPEPFRAREDGYHINDFLKYHDQQFIINAYRGLLRRGPDSAGHDHFLNNLRSGKMTKAEILGRLRYSPEGRAGRVNIRGLFWNFVIQSSYNIPVLGYFSRLGVGIANLPSIIRNIQVIEENAFSVSQQQQGEVAAAFENLRPILDRKTDTSQLVQLKSEIESLLAQKPDREELGNVKAALESVLGRKIEHDELENLRSHLQLMLDQTPDRDELANLKTELESVLEHKPDRDELANLKTELESVLEHKPDRDELANLKAEVDSGLAHKLNKEELNPVNDQIRDILRQTRDHKLNIIDQQRRLKLLLEEARKRFPEPLSTDQIAKMVKEKDHLLDAAYVSFEDQFRGTREDIKERLKVYLPYISEAGAGKEDSPIIDVGCGRGEWLELLKEEGLVARGVDINDILVGECRDLGFDVINADALEYLKTLPPKSVGAITGFHIIEHLPFGSLIELLDETLRVLKPDGISIFETPNPENILVASFRYYFDPTHRNPLPPEMINFLVESRGFCRVEILRLHPEEPISRIEDDGSELVKRFNEYFYGSMDYAVIGYSL